MESRELFLKKVRRELGVRPYPQVRNPKCPDTRLLAASESESDTACKEEESAGWLRDSDEADLAGIVLRTVRCVSAAPGPGIHAVGRQSSIGTAGIEEADGSAGGKEKVIRDNIVRCRSAGSLKSSRAEQQRVIKRIAGCIGRENKIVRLRIS